MGAANPLYIGCQCCVHVEEIPESGYPKLIEPKLDGFRLMAHVDLNGEVALMVRDGASEPYNSNLPGIKAELASLGLRGAWFDGELQAENWNETAKLVRLKAPNEEERSHINARVFFNLFDVMPEAAIELRDFPRCKAPKKVVAIPQIDRCALLVRLLDGSFKHLRAVSRSVVGSKDEAASAHEAFLAAGAEGSVLKELNAQYVFDSREAWIAVKPVKTIEGKVVGFYEGAGKHVGRLGSLLCKMDDGTEFAVGTGFSDEQRAEIWADQKRWLGRWVEVKCQSNQTTAVVRHPAFLRWREDRGKRDLQLSIVEPGHKADARKDVPLAEAQQIAAHLVDELFDLGCERVAVAGSVRRCKPLVNDIDLLVMPPKDASIRFESLGLAGGAVRYRGNYQGVHVDVMVVRDPAEWGAALMHLTGSKETNIRQRARALQFGLTLNEKGLWAGKNRLAGEAEDDVYTTLGLAWLQPQQR